ncbi:MAG TPA: NrfD/PsrC family molybdoenzyme membrane anchor subunit, partial [Ktedonobacterales bacterium]|nr:NrfD/PsrC family molybdoenzyme membrane anchor subunit [Ktedonobacterales bacterium]
MSAIEQSPRSPSASGAPAFLREGQRRTATPAQETTYYQRPMIKRPTWKWYIPLYFVLGGVAGGTALIGAAAELLGGPRHRSTVRHARYVGLAIAPLCAGLLIADLGRPSRFHHMLRIFKASSPLNVGTWILSLFGVTSGVLAARQATEDGFLLRRESALAWIIHGASSRPIERAEPLGYGRVAV